MIGQVSMGEDAAHLRHERATAHRHQWEQLVGVVEEFVQTLRTHRIQSNWAYAPKLIGGVRRGWRVRLYGCELLVEPDGNWWIVHSAIVEQPKRSILLRRVYADALVGSKTEGFRGNPLDLDILPAHLVRRLMVDFVSQHMA